MLGGLSGDILVDSSDRLPSLEFVLRRRLIMFACSWTSSFKLANDPSLRFLFFPLDSVDSRCSQLEFTESLSASPTVGSLYLPGWLLIFSIIS